MLIVYVRYNITVETANLILVVDSKGSPNDSNQISISRDIA